jgi:hypothetical protein
MVYRFIRAFNELYGVTIFGGFVAAFFIALAMMLYPIVAIVMLIWAIYAVVVFWAVGRVLRALERGIARRGIVRQRCPACGGALERFVLPEVADAEVHDCSGCSRAYLPSGEQWSPAQSTVGTPPQPTQASCERGLAV